MARGLFYYLITPLLALAALIQSTAGNQLVLGGVKPDLALVLVVVATLLYGGRAGLGWAFVGGLFLDIFSGGPLGSSSLALMAGALVASVGHNILSRFNLLVPLGLMALATIAYGVTYVSVLQVLSAVIEATNLTTIQHNLPFWPTFQEVILPSVAYNTIIMLVLIPVLNRVPETPEVVTTLP